MEIRASSPSEPACVRLLSQLDAYLMALYPSNYLHLLTLDELLRPEVAFVAARERGAVLGCGALVRRHGYGEIKRMYVEPAARGRRIGERIIRFLEHLSAAQGIALLRLETGSLQPEALRLYARTGYRRAGPFGDYTANSMSVFMEKRL